MTSAIGLVEQAVGIAETTPPPEWLTKLSGYYGSKFQMFLHSLVGTGMKYLEIGVFRGASLCAAASSGKGECWGIDNFSLRRSSYNVVMAEKEAHGLNFNLVKGDCFDPDIIAQIPTGFQVFYYDGDHSTEATKRGLVTYLPKLADEAILIVDDWNWDPVRLGMLDGIDAVEAEGWEVTLVKSINSPVTYTTDHFGKIFFVNRHTVDNGDKEGWWNGVGLFVLQKTGTSAAPKEPVEANKGEEVHELSA